MTKILQYLIDKLFKKKTAVLWHPELPGEKCTVHRSLLGRIFKPTAFATLSESLKDGIEYHDFEDGEFLFEQFSENCRVTLRGKVTFDHSILKWVAKFGRCESISESRNGAMIAAIQKFLRE